MHQSHSTQEYVQGVVQIVVEGLDLAIARVLAAEQSHDIIKCGLRYSEIIIRAYELDYIACL